MEMEEKIETAIQELAEQLQVDCNETVKEIIKISKKCSHQDATNVWIFRHLAILALKIEGITSFINKTKN